MSEERNPSAGGPAVPKPIGDRAQLELLDALERLSPRLARMYEGALRAFAAIDNPDCLAQSALSMREIFDKLHLATKHQPPHRTVSMKTKANELRRAWQIVIQSSAAYQSGSGTWTGEVNGALNRFLGAVAEFINYLARDMPFRRDELSRILNSFDPAPGPLPVPHVDERRSTLENLHEYMNNVAHHNFEPPREEFAERLTSAEKFLMDLIQPLVAPRPYEDRAVLDALLQEKPDAN